MPEDYGACSQLRPPQWEQWSPLYVTTAELKWCAGVASSTASQHLAGKCLALVKIPDCRIRLQCDYLLEDCFVLGMRESCKWFFANSFQMCRAISCITKILCNTKRKQKHEGTCTYRPTLFFLWKAGLENQLVLKCDWSRVDDAIKSFSSTQVSFNFLLRNKSCLTCSPHPWLFISLFFL